MASEVEKEKAEVDANEGEVEAEAAAKAPEADAKAKAPEADAKAKAPAEAKAKAPEAEAKAKALTEGGAKAPEAQAKSSERPAASHDEKPAAAHGSHRAKYLKVFYALIGLTALELGVVYAGLSRSTVILLLIGLAFTKAGAVAAWFMHLADERRVLRLMVGLPLLFPPFYACVLIAEAVFRSTIASVR
jgi:caa(3)-type oxidase subunit IV